MLNQFFGRESLPLLDQGQGLADGGRRAWRLRGKGLKGSGQNGRLSSFDQSVEADALAGHAVQRALTTQTFTGGPRCYVQWPLMCSLPSLKPVSPAFMGFERSRTPHNSDPVASW